jgi:hypothetical protein
MIMILCVTYKFFILSLSLNFIYYAFGFISLLMKIFIMFFNHLENNADQNDSKMKGFIKNNEELNN